MEQDEKQHRKQGKVETCQRDFTESSEPGETEEVAYTAFTLLAEEDCQILSGFAASLRGSEISTLIKWVLMFGGR